jgi:hypothetical protein
LDLFHSCVSGVCRVRFCCWYDIEIPIPMPLVSTRGVYIADPPSCNGPIPWGNGPGATGALFAGGAVGGPLDAGLVRALDVARGGGPPDDDAAFWEYAPAAFPFGRPTLPSLTKSSETIRSGGTP